MPVSDFVNDDAVFSEEVVAAVEAYAASMPWVGNRAAKMDKLHNLHEALCEACGVDDVGLCTEHDPDAWGRPVALVRTDYGDRVILVPSKLSVVSYLFSFAEVLFEDDGEKRMTFAVNLFKRYFPEQFANCDLTGPVVRSNGRRQDP